LKSPVDANWQLEILETVSSTQDAAARAVRQNRPIGAILARRQTHGRGRFGRKWSTGSGDSLTMTLIFRDWRDHPAPYVPGMALAVACARALNMRVQWPNDIVCEGRKVGGILTEVVEGIPLVGIGVNLNQEVFPEEIAYRAGSVWQCRGERLEPEGLAAWIFRELERLPEITAWEDLDSAWRECDETPGKVYVDAEGRTFVAESVTREGSLLVDAGPAMIELRAADAWFGPDR
jgi:BirA family biotin operon repressor/biotin-[acetyl-CoA-carboxylase] ligase